MPLIDPDMFSFAGAVRIRASAPDPFAGLRGRAYIAARKLDERPLEKFESEAVAQAKRERKENLIRAINQGQAIAWQEQKFVLASGSMEWLKGPTDRRFFLLPELTAEEL